MPKIIELTAEIEIQRVSCPGVWLCQDGRVSLTVFALGTSYQTCLLPPMFPLLFKDVFYFRKRFQETCTLNNISCVLKDETIFCELVQWCEDCNSGQCVILAQYLGALNDVLFPPNMCSTDGVDLLMRRSKNFPGILSPKIEIATKVRIDEVRNSGMNPLQWKSPCSCSADPERSRQRQVCHTPQYHNGKSPCSCSADPERSRQRQVCHTPQYHKSKCRRPCSRSRSSGSHSCASLQEPVSCKCPNPPGAGAGARRRSSASRSRTYQSYNVCTVTSGDAWSTAANRDHERMDLEDDNDTSPFSSRPASPLSPVTSCSRIHSRSRHPEDTSAETREHSARQRKRSTAPREGSTTLRESTSPRLNRTAIMRRDRSPPTDCSTIRSTYQQEGLMQRGGSPHRSRSRQFASVYSVNTEKLPAWARKNKEAEDLKDDFRDTDRRHSPSEELDKYKKIQLESRYIEDAKDRYTVKESFKKFDKPRLKPCICEICKRYHELFHGEPNY